MILRGGSKGHAVARNGDESIGASATLDESIWTSGDKRRVGYTSLCEGEFALGPIRGRG